ncbi:MAG TPA: prepilin-type N-terminal cleavage/methylation domain-containing protein [Planctomycetota bacterium]|nr:prepilin-type N-terminal cleavage/methylation domain-containing protein [Planctomycetota bacterium]
MNVARSSRRGLTLIELLVYMGVLTIVVGVAWLVYYRCIEHSLGVLRNVDDITRALKSGERWRTEVRRATAPPRLVDGVLHVATPDGDVLFKFAGDAVLRKGAAEARWAPFLPKVKASRMQLDEGKHVSSWRWEVELESRAKAGIRPLFSFRAVPSGRAPR